MWVGPRISMTLVMQLSAVEAILKVLINYELSAHCTPIQWGNQSFTEEKSWSYNTGITLTGPLLGTVIIRGDICTAAYTPAPQCGQWKADCRMWGIEGELRFLHVCS